MARPKVKKIKMVPIDRIDVLNPRTRNKRQHREIVDSIKTVGLKRPITVSRKKAAGSPRYDLVCGEGRIEAFRMLGKTEIPAIVIEASEADCLVMSLVENIGDRGRSRTVGRIKRGGEDGGEPVRSPPGWP